MVPTLRLCVVFSAFTVGMASVITSNQKSDNFELLILHNNDMHARFEQTSQLSGVCSAEDREANKCYGGFPRVAHVVKEARKAAENGSGPPVLYLNAGDTYTGTAWFTIYKWKIAAECINALKPDAVSLGNHEFDEGISGLTPFIEELNCPVLAANLILDKEPTLESQKNLHDYVILEVSGVKIGIIGYLTPDTSFLADRTNVIYIEEVKSLKKVAKILQDKGINIIIALGHSGFLKDKEIAKEVDGIDLVIGGHTNTFLWNGTCPDAEPIQGPYPTLVKQKSGRIVPVVQAYAYTKYLGQLLLTFNSDGEIVNYSGAPILLDKSIPQDPEVLRLITSYGKNITQITEKVVGTSDAILDGNCRLRECNMGTFVTDSMVDYFVKYYRNNNWNDVPIAVVQGGRIRNSISHSTSPIFLTRGDWITALPFSGNLVIVTMNGSVLLKALEHTVISWRLLDKPGQFLQMSGMEVVYDFSKPPGSRVVKALARCTKCKRSLKVIKDDEEYKVMMPAFLSQGGDGFFMFDHLPVQKLPYGEKVCVEHYLKENSPISPKLTGRIKILNEEVLSKSNGAVSLNTSILTIVILIYIVL